MSNEGTVGGDKSSTAMFMRGVRIAIAAAALVILILFIAANFQTVEVDFLVTSTSTRLAFALLGTAVLGFIVGYVTARFTHRGI